VLAAVVASRFTEIRHGCTGVVDAMSVRCGPVSEAEPSEPPSRNTSTLAIFVAPVTHPWISAPPQGSAFVPVNSMRPAMVPHAP